PLAPVRENQVDAFEMEARFAAVFRECLAQFRCVGRPGETGQRPNHLNFSVVEHAEFVEIEILQRPETHVSPRDRRDMGSYARRMPRVAEPEKMSYSGRMTWQQANIQAAAAYMRGLIGVGATDARTKAVYEGLLDVLDPPRRAIRVQRESALAAKAAVAVKAERDRRAAAERRSQRE